MDDKVQQSHEEFSFKVPASWIPVSPHEFIHEAHIATVT